MSRNYDELLDRFDPTGLDRYGITTEDLAAVEKYVCIGNPMIRFRRLQVRDDRGRWVSEAYAVEDETGQVTLHYPLSWEHLGSEYNGMIRDRQLSLDRLEELISGECLRWLSPETVTETPETVLDALARECHIPDPVALKRERPPLELQARIVGEDLQLVSPSQGPIRVQGNRIYLDDGRELVIRLKQAA